jgi:hypothetical protein
MPRDHDTYRIVIEPTGIRGERGQRYQVRFEGEILIEDAANPELEACRALVVRGLAGRLDVWRAGEPHPSIIIPDIAVAAFRTVKEYWPGAYLEGAWRAAARLAFACS